MSSDSEKDKKTIEDKMEMCFIDKRPNMISDAPIHDSATIEHINQLISTYESLSDEQLVSKMNEIVPDLDNVDDAVEAICNSQTNKSGDFYYRLCNIPYKTVGYSDEISEIIGGVYDRSIKEHNREDFTNYYIDHLEWEDLGETLGDYMINEPDVFTYIEQVFDDSTKFRDALWDYCVKENIQYPDIWDNE